MSNASNRSAAAERDAVIVRTGAIGIAANVVLAAFKAILGLAVHSVAMVLDAVNNLSDALGSIITIIGTKLAGKRPDKKHPLGYGRVEYLTSMIISALVLYAGITALVESVKGILHPQTPSYSTASLAVMAVAIVVKLVLGRYNKRVGGQVNSASLTASGADALYDAALSASVLASAVIFLLAEVDLQAWVGVLIAVFIIRSGLEMLRDSADEVLGKRLDPELTHSIRRTVCEDPDVLGAYDLLLHSYGPERLVGSVHVEIADTMTATQIDRMERRIADTVFARHGVLLTGIGIYSADRSSGNIRDRIVGIVRSHDGVLQLHGFFADEETRQAGFDVILDYAMENRNEVFEALSSEVRAAFPDYTFQINLDIDV